VVATIIGSKVKRLRSCGSIVACTQSVLDATERLDAREVAEHPWFLLQSIV